MQYCSKCGNQMQDNAQFCPQCGATANRSQPRGAKGMHCPECGCYDLRVFVESSGVALGTTQMDTHRSWVCNSCGHMFRHPDDVIKELKDKLKKVTIPFAALAIFIIFMALIDGGIGFLLIGGVIIGGAVFLVRYFVKKEMAKAEELRKACFE